MPASQQGRICLPYSSETISSPACAIQTFLMRGQSFKSPNWKKGVRGWIGAQPSPPRRLDSARAKSEALSEVGDFGTTEATSALTPALQRREPPGRRKKSP